MDKIKISVRDLIEFILRSGDITSSMGIRDIDAMQEGTRIHKKLQKHAGGGYMAEVPLSITLPVNYDDVEFELCVEGRADGIFPDNGIMTIDEIKGVYYDINLLPEPVAIHRAQALCYGYIYASGHKLDGMGIQITYCHIPTEEVRHFNEYIEYDKLKLWFENLINEYSKWIAWQIKWHETRNSSIKDFEFPFEYRPGQNNLVKGAYQSILRKKRLYIEAPTGVGKTISTVYPSVKALGEGIAEKIFYLTAKTITRTVAEETFNILADKGVKLKSVTITAKEKICIFDKPQCHPFSCPRAHGHFDRVNDAVYDVITNEMQITRNIINTYAEKHNVCPFEMCLDISTWVDAVIGDYNYAFDPNASLKRFFGTETQNNYIFLIDEAHNLVERARQMYSAELTKESFLETRQITKRISKKLTKELGYCNQSLLELKRNCEELKKYDIIDIEEFVIKLMRLAACFDEFFQKPASTEHITDTNLREKLLEFYFNVRSFLSVYDGIDSKYLIYSDYNDNNDFCLHLKCMDPSKNLDIYLNKARAAIFFSATLIPVKYYKEQLAGRADDYAIYAPSPFSADNRLLMIASDISTKYTRRGPDEYKKAAEYIYQFISIKKGNYMIFFPSYKLMEDIGEYLCEKLCFENIKYTKFIMDGGVYNPLNEVDDYTSKEVYIYQQSSSMNEQQREEFLAHFEDTSKQTTIGFCVMGGIFSEGIDLKGNRLIGTVIVGTGLPMVCTENELFREYFDNKKNAGFNYAYQYPGMNKVLQAAGRVIRTDTDRGAILLLDERFLQKNYRELFPREWFPYQVVTKKSIKYYTEKFWNP